MAVDFRAASAACRVHTRARARVCLTTVRAKRAAGGTTGRASQPRQPSPWARSPVRAHSHFDAISRQRSHKAPAQKGAPSLPPKRPKTPPGVSHSIVGRRSRDDAGSSYDQQVQFEWDSQKAARNLETHGISVEDAACVFGDPLAATIPDPEHSTSWLVSLLWE